MATKATKPKLNSGVESGGGGGYGFPAVSTPNIPAEPDCEEVLTDPVVTVTVLVDNSPSESHRAERVARSPPCEIEQNS